MMTGFKAAAIALVGLTGGSMCTSVQLVAPYDATLEQSLGERRQELSAIIETLRSDLADGAPPYSDYEARYIALSSKLDTAAARARLSSPQVGARACALPSEVRQRLQNRIGQAGLNQVQPAGADGGGATDATAATATGCTARLLANTVMQFDNFTNFHYCATVARPAGEGQDASNWQARCPDGAVQLNTASLDAAGQLTMQTLEYAWAVEIAKKPETGGNS